jgi:hypothetical protein
MNTKSLALIISFAAIAIALNAIKIPAVFWPGNFFQLSDIPIVVAFLLFGVRVGVFVGVLNLLGQLAFYLISPVYIVAYPMGFIATLLTLLGVYIACRYIARKNSSGKLCTQRPIIYLTGFAVISRAAIMPIIDYQIFFGLLFPIFSGYAFPETYMVGLIPVLILFNIIIPLYTIPVAYTVASRVKKVLKMEPELIK